MANELKLAVDQLKSTLANDVANVNRVTLGQPLTAIPNTAHNACEVFLYLVSGASTNNTFTDTTESHRVDARFYWLLSPQNSEVVEQNMLSMWDLVMTVFYGDDADRNLTETCTLSLVNGENGQFLYEAGYATLSKKLHRVLTIPFGIILDTHSV
jgi:hypothetical protein